MAAGPTRDPGWRMERGGSDAVLVLTGDWIARQTGLRDAAAVREMLAAARGARRLRIDAVGLGRWDSALVVFVQALREARTAAIAPDLPAELDESGLPPPVRHLLALAAEADLGAPPAVPPRPPAWSFARLGRPAIADWQQAIDMSGLVGDVVLHAGAVLTGRLRTRAGEVVRLMADAGAGALGIVALVNALVGGILAFVASVQLRRFGTQIYVADLVGISIAREMAAITTAIVMAGRTGGAYAAQIATMEGNEEIDALKALGIPVREYLVLPRVVALTTMMPLLYIYACAVGLVGAMLVALSTLDLSYMAYIRETQLAVTRTHLTLGVLKGVTFGAAVALAGCHIGLRAGRSAADVGRAATVAVVVGIVGIIAIDAVFAVCTDALRSEPMAAGQIENNRVRVQGLTVAYGPTPVQRDLSFSVRQGSVFAIMGGSGCGKSTVLKALIGLLRPRAGTVTIDGEDYWAVPGERRSEISRRFGVVFQSSALWSSMSVAENVALPLQMFTALPPGSIEALVRLKLSLVGLRAAGHQMPADLSGGMRKRAGIARALALDPEILFLDEPSAGLDPITAKRLDELVLGLRDGLGVTIVMVSHDLPTLFAICDDGVFLDAETHTAIAHGAPRALRDDCDVPAVRAFMARARLEDASPTEGRHGAR